MFKMGNEVICVNPGDYTDILKAGEQYTIARVEQKSLGEYLVFLEGFEQSCGGMYSWRFELAESVDQPASIGMGLAGPDPSKPYPNPELEAARQQQQNLIDYKRMMRDYLYGMTSEDE